MKWLLANPFNTLPPLGLIAVGALVGAAGLPIVKKTVHSLAVLTVRGVMAVNDVVKDTGGNAKINWDNMVEKARVSDLNSHQTKMKVLEDENENPKSGKHSNNNPVIDITENNS